ncbi:MAG: hypothetical protein JXA93_06455, partial [Anaerolineae bacterium]|nr:hypothetical protein [Anaerolineae bacterium]
DYVLIESGASVSAEVDLAKVYDLAEAGTYTVQFVSPTISDVARTRAEMATTVDELGPVSIPSEAILIEVEGEGGAPAAAGTTDRATTITGTVADVSPSARIVTFVQAVDGVSVVALTEGSELVGADGAGIALREVRPGVIIEATGQRGKADALLASQVRVVADMYLGWKQYTNRAYEFAFRYPPTWLLEEEANLVRLKQGTLLITIAFRRPDEHVQSVGSGMPAGEIKGRGTIEILGQEVEEQALVYEGKVKALTYDAHVASLVLNIRFEDMAAVDYRATDIPDAMQHEVDQIVGSLSSTATGSGTEGR